MCNINEHTTLKSVTVYKKAFVYKTRLLDKEAFYSPFAGTPIEVGPVIPQTDETLYRGNEIFFYECFSDYNSGTNRFYNPNMDGKCSGFETLADCKSLCLFSNSNAVILKIELGGEIMKGDAENIGSYVREDAIVYAGTIIKSIEVIQKC